MNIKITYLVDFLRTINAGTEKQLGYLLPHLPDAGYSVELISLQDSPFLRNEAPRLFSGIAVKTLGAKSDISKSLSTLPHLFNILHRTRPHIVHTFFPASNSIGVLIAKIAGISKVISSRRDMGFNLTQKDIRLLKIANRFVSCVVANSNAVREKTIQLEGLSKTRIQVIYNGISLLGYNRLLVRRASQIPTVGIVANLNRSVKRVDLFLRAAALVKKDLPNVRYWIVGDGQLRKGMEELAYDLGLNSSVHFLGCRQDVREILSEMSVGVICSDSEGFSNAIMEYMAYGIPVVATSVGGNVELVEHEKTGLLIPPGDHKALAQALSRCLRNPDSSMEMGLAGRGELFRAFSKEKMLQATEELYQNLLND